MVELLEREAEALDRRSPTTFPPLTATERQKILVEWNHTQADYPQQF